MGNVFQNSGQGGMWQALGQAFGTALCCMTGNRQPQKDDNKKGDGPWARFFVGLMCLLIVLLLTAMGSCVDRNFRRGHDQMGSVDVTKELDKIIKKGVW